MRMSAPRDGVLSEKSRGDFFLFSKKKRALTEFERRISLHEFRMCILASIRRGSPKGIHRNTCGNERSVCTKNYQIFQCFSEGFSQRFL